MQPKCPTSVHITAEKFKEVCLNENQLNNEDNLNEIKNFINYLFNPENDLNTTTNNVTKIIDYICGGLDYNDFKTRVKHFDQSSVCGLVWSTHYVAYRCRTCGISPCMSICAECFKNGNHDGHDFNMFRSGAGGACDCGDSHVMHKDGFCKFHGPNRDLVTDPPVDLIKCTEIIIPHLIYRILQYLRSYFSETEHLITIIDSIGDAHSYIEFLNELCSLGTAMRKLIVDYMISDEFYTEKISTESLNQQNTASSTTTTSETIKTTYLHKTFTDLLESTERANILTLPKTFKDFDTSVLLKRKYTNIINELLYWCIKYEFPENLVKFLLSLLPDQRYKIEFTKSFVSHYYIISNTILTHSSNYLSSRVVHISVQLFSNELITIKALNEYNLLEIFMITLNNIINNTNNVDLLKLNELNNSNKHYVINVDHHILQENLYWPIVSDLVNLLSHKQVAIKFLTNENIISTWFDLVQNFQSMNLNKRQLQEHIQYEQPTYFSSFSAELEFCSSILWSFIQHLTTYDQLEISKSILQKLIVCLNTWLGLVNIKDVDGNVQKTNNKHLSFHLPLHRYFSIFLYNAIFNQNAKLNELLPNSHLLDLLAYPLQTQICFYEIHSNLWIRNGLQMKGQAMTYIQSHFCSSFSDADLFLIQSIACCNLNEECFINYYFDRFYVLDLCKELKCRSLSQNDQDSDSVNYMNFNQRISMLIGSLTLLAQIIYIKPNLSLNDYDLTRVEIINLLCMADRTYSQIEENLPDICSLSSSKKHIAKILSEVADFIEPLSYEHGLKQGTYVPKDHIWLNEYDPLYVMLRSVKLREFQESFDRYCDFIKLKNFNLNKLWPPFRLTNLLDQKHADLNKRLNLLNTKTLHGILFTLLYWYLNETFLPEKAFYFVAYILELSVQAASLNTNKSTVDSNETFDDSMDDMSDHERIVEEGNFDSWFSSCNIFDNLCTDIDLIGYEESQHVLNEQNVKDSELPDNKDDTKNFLFFKGLKSKIIQLPPFKKVCAAFPFLNKTFETESDKPSTSKPKLVTYNVNESMLSLLVKIMNKNINSTTADDKPSTSNKMPKFDFSLNSLNEDSSIDDSRIGDEYYYLSNLLKRIAKFNLKCKLKIEKIVQRLNLIRKDNEQLIDEDNDDTKRKKAKAKARQNKLMAQMASHQSAFLSHLNYDENLDEDKPELESSTNEDTIIPQKIYDCCICRVSSVATSERPIGLIAFVQSSSVLGHREKVDSPKRDALISNFDENSENEVCWTLEKNRINLLKQEFDAESLKYSMNIGWKGGVFTQSCGHYLHFDCYNSYKETTSIQTPQNFNTFTNSEYCCPLCRRIANSLLPIINYSTHLKYENYKNKILKNKSVDLSAIEDDPVALIGYLLKNRSVFDVDYNSRAFTPCINDAFTAIFDSADSDFRFIEPTLFNLKFRNTDADNTLFLTSVLRTQLEISLILKECPELCISTSVKRSCFLPLFDVLSTHCRLTCAENTPHLRLWSLLTEPNKTEYSNNKNVPLLIHDPVSILILIIVNLPARVHKRLYHIIVSNIFNFAYIQNIFTCLVLKKFGLTKINQTTDANMVTFEDYENYILQKLNSFEKSTLFMTQSDSQLIEPFNIIQSSCMRFLKIASLLQAYIYEDELEFNFNSFENLLDYLQIGYKLTQNEFTLKWENINRKELIDFWLDQVFNLANEQIHQLNSIIQINTIEYKKPDLISLPQLYSDLFCYYSQKRCKYCSKIQKESVICLLCGTHMSYKTSCCCEQMKIINKTHLKECGAGTVMFININSTYVHILRGKRYASWASLYLDEHGEEDRDLKRGKPLYLSKQRYDLLKALWTSHAFEYQNIKWFSASLFVF